MELIKENGFTLKKKRTRQFPTQNMTDVDYADDLLLFRNTPAQAESLLHSLEQAAGNIGVCVDTNKTEFM